MTDSEWEQLLCSFPSKAYKTLIEQYEDLIHAIVFNKIGNCGPREDVEDRVSDIMVEIFRNAKKYSVERESLKTYISTIAKRRDIDTFRQLSTKNNMFSDPEDENIFIPPASDNTEEETEKRIFSQKLRNTVKSLGEPDCSIIVYQYFYKYKINEIAKILEMAAESVKKRSLRARKKICVRLRKDGYHE